MTTTPKQNHKRSLIIGGVLTLMTLICIAMTCLFVYVSNDASQQIESIREDYRKIADRRDKKVAGLSEQVQALQQQMNSLPDKTANKTAAQVKQVVREDEEK